MVNKAVVGLLLGVVVVTLLVAGLITALAGGGPAAAGTPTPTEVQPTPLGAGTDTAATPSATPAATATSVVTSPAPARTPTATAEPRTAAYTTIAADEFHPGEIESVIRRLVNDRREARGLEPLSDEREAVKKLNPMARGHSEEMARINDVRYTIDNRSTGDRYRQHDLYGTCKWKATDGDYVIKPDFPRDTQLEVIGMTMAGRPYTENGEPRFHGNETEVARSLVADWFDGYPDESKFYLEEASQVGVGVHVTLSGEVYATVALC